MQDEQLRFLPLAAKTVVCGTLTYFLMGALPADRREVTLNAIDSKLDGVADSHS